MLSWVAELATELDAWEARSEELEDRLEPAACGLRIEPH